MDNLDKKVIKKVQSKRKSSSVPSKKEVGFVEWLAAKKKLDSTPRGIGSDRSKIAEAQKELDEVEAQILKQL